MKFTNRINLAELKYVPTTKLIASSYLTDIYSDHLHRPSPEPVGSTSHNGQVQNEQKSRHQDQKEEIQETAKKYSFGKSQLSPDSQTDRKQYRVQRIQRKNRLDLRQQQKQVTAFQYRQSKLQPPKEIQQHRVYKSKYLQEKDRKQNLQSQKIVYKKAESKPTCTQEVSRNQTALNNRIPLNFQKRTSQGANDRISYLRDHQHKSHYQTNPLRANSQFFQSLKFEEKQVKKEYKLEQKDIQTSDSYLSNKKSIVSEGKLSLRQSLCQQSPYQIQKVSDLKYKKFSRVGSPNAQDQMSTLKELREKLLKIKNQNNIKKEKLFKSFESQVGFQNSQPAFHKTKLKQLQVQKIRRQIRQAIDRELKYESPRQNRRQRR